MPERWTPPRFVPGKDRVQRATMKVSHELTVDDLVDLLTITVLIAPPPRRKVGDPSVPVLCFRAMREVLRVHGDGWRAAVDDCRRSSPVAWAQAREQTFEQSRSWW